MMRVAFQGELGAFSEEAVRVFFGAAAEPVACREFADVAAAVVHGDVAFGLLPVENTLAGSVVAAYDVLVMQPLEIVGEVATPIHHCVLGLPGAELDGLASIRSHPVALAQCTRFFAAHPRLQAVAAYDTAGAARDVAAGGNSTLGAIAGRGAAERYGLAVLAADVEDRPDNQTRFLVVAPRGGDSGALLPRRANGAMKTALVAETANAPGALVGILAPFAARGINLSKLESRPTGEPWRYRFLIEIDADARGEDAMAALAEACGHASRLDVLGSFPRWSAPSAPPGEQRPSPASSPMAEVTRIRPARAEDASGISALIHALSGRFTLLPGGEGAEAFFATVTEDAIRGYIAAPAYQYLVAETEGELAGVAALRDGRHLYHLFVALAAQGQGLGRRLWMMLMESALQAGNPGEFTVNASLEAVPVYERFGFRATGPHTEANGIAFVPMRLDLAAGSR